MAVAAVLLLACSAGEAGRPKVGNLDTGRQALQQNAYRAAVVELERAIVADPRNPEGYVLLGQAYQGLGSAERALKYYRLALELEPGHRRALMLRGEAYLHRGDLLPAEETLAQLAAKCNADCLEFQRLNRSVSSYKAKSQE